MIILFLFGVIIFTNYLNVNRSTDFQIQNKSFNKSRMETEKNSSYNSRSYSYYPNYEFKTEYFDDRFFSGKNINYKKNILFDTHIGKVTQSKIFKTYGEEYREIGFSVQQANNYGYYIVGSTQSYGVGGDCNFGPCEDIWLIRTDDFGNEIWNKTFGGNKSDKGKWSLKTEDDGILILGLTYSYGNKNTWLLKINSYGFLEWEKLFYGKE